MMANPGTQTFTTLNSTNDKLLFWWEMPDSQHTGGSGSMCKNMVTARWWQLVKLDELLYQSFVNDELYNELLAK